MGVCQFQSTLPQGERRVLKPELDREAANFNPRSRKGSDQIADTYLYLMPDFNPRSRKGSDALKYLRGFNRWLFQSTLPQGERRIDPFCIVLGSVISIHAPARGATVPRQPMSLGNTYFNPRSRKGSDIALLTEPKYRFYFNPRSRKGSDLLERDALNGKSDFNPRSRKGSDLTSP